MKRDRLPVTRPPAALNHARKRLAMGTFATIELASLAEPLAVTAMNAAFEVIASIEARMHPSRAGSDLACLNNSTGAQSVVVDSSTFEVLTLAKAIAAASDGLFDPCLPAGDGTIDDVELAADRRVHCRRRVMLDLGGIAKGYAVDQALRCLREHHCENALVNIGGDIGAFGASAHAIGVRVRGQIRRHVLRNGALAVSDTQYENYPKEHRGYYSRKDQRPLRKTFAAVSAPSAAVADALTKCALYCEESAWSALAKKFGAVLLA
jgi:FAD:protein FMN transferase